MAIALQYNPEKKILYATIIDKLSSSEFADMLKKISDSDDYPPDVGILWDTTSIEKPIGNKQFESDIIEIRKRFPEGGKAKFAIITSGDFIFSMNNIYKMRSEEMPKNIKVFSNFIDSEEWLAEIGK